MSEDALWGTTRVKLSPYGELERVENAVGDGTPDVNYCLLMGRAVGWLELKFEPRWTSGEYLILSTLRYGQVAWQERWSAKGGRVYTLAKIGSAFLLIAPALLRLIYERTVTPDAAIAGAIVYSPNKFPTKELLKALL